MNQVNDFAERVGMFDGGKGSTKRESSEDTYVEELVGTE
jgi:hypothetical protein